MYLLALGILGLALKYLQIGPVANFSWGLVMLPFALAVVWWALADASGYTQRKELKKMDDRKKKRHNKHRVAMGLVAKKRL